MALSQNKKIELLNKLRGLLTKEELNDINVTLKLLWIGVGFDFAACESMINRKYIEQLFGLTAKE